MSNVIFGFNGNEFNVQMTELDAKDLFYKITGISIIDDDYIGVQHPTTRQLIELFRNNISNEIGSELIKNTFYPNYKGEWTKILVNIYGKIQNALKTIEMSENGIFKKRKSGKYVKYLFIRNNKQTVTLDNYGIE